MGLVKFVTISLSLALVSCSGGSGTSLTPEQVGQLTFQHLKNNDFTSYFTTVVADPAIVRFNCPALVGIDRHFDSGDGSARVQEDAFIECRNKIDFAGATLTRVNIQQQSSELVRPECSQTLLRVLVHVEVSSGGSPAYFTIDDVTQFSSGWRAFRKIIDCGLTPPGTP